MSWTTFGNATARDLHREPLDDHLIRNLTSLHAAVINKRNGEVPLLARRATDTLLRSARARVPGWPRAVTGGSR